MADGQQERLRCPTTYHVADGGEALRLNICCVSPSYNFDPASNVQARGSEIFDEASCNASGSISSGRTASDHIEAAQG